MNIVRVIRLFEVSYKGSIFFSSEDGVQVAMIFHTIIETAKMYGLEVKAYLTRVLSELRHGEDDYEKLLPGNITL